MSSTPLFGFFGLRWSDAKPMRVNAVYFVEQYPGCEEGIRGLTQYDRGTERHDRPLPFVMRVAAEWTRAANADDGALVYRKRARLTGELATTATGRDVTFSDIGIAR